MQAPTTEAFIVDVQPSLQGVEFKDYPVTIMDKDGKQVRIGQLHIGERSDTHSGPKEINQLVAQLDLNFFHKVVGSVRKRS